MERVAVGLVRERDGLQLISVWHTVILVHRIDAEFAANGDFPRRAVEHVAGLRACGMKMLSRCGSVFTQASLILSLVGRALAAISQFGVKELQHGFP